LTALYAFRWYFMVFSGPAGPASELEIHRPRDLMLYPLLALAAGSLLVGVLESYSSFWASAYKEVIVFTLIIPVLLWRSFVTPHAEEEEE
jgi:NADH:ubiquinone oxidoreductase subunit 5 (subunit L)/multisubunit Na+/H+ antiporter MnhA subunit